MSAAASAPIRNELLDQIAAFATEAERASCLTTPFGFDSDHARYLYFRDPTARAE